jgi:RNA polymerase sigma-70 factor, ECF subfamily
LEENYHNGSGQDTASTALAAQAARGDTGAFGRLYDLYADRIYRHIYYRTGNPDDAKDLMQEVFTRAWQALPRYKKSKTPFLGWLFTIAHNRIIDYYRAKKDYAYLTDEIIIPDQAPGPEKLAETQFTQRAVRKAILQLPGDQQQVVIMSFIEGFEYHEIAAALNKSEGNIRVMMHRALRKMREIMGSGEV